jgi:UDP-3-O-[3-hydroxymyristoyl] glucosamine N-acyltransferase
MVEFTADQIARLLNGKVVGDGEVKLNIVAKIEEGHAGALSFLANPKYINYIYTTGSSAVLVNNDFSPEKPVSATLIYVENAYEAFATLLDMVADAITPKKTGIEQPCFIDPSVKMGEDVYVGAFAYVGKGVRLGNNVKIYPQSYVGDNVVIGDNSIINSGVKIYYNCQLGNSVTIHSGAVIGADGFGFAPNSENNYKKIPQIGNVVIEDFVEIGANSTIDRATMGSTVIRKGVKLDNMVHIAHNVEIGENTVMAAQSGIAGSSKVGRDSMFGGQVGIAPHVKLANGLKLGAKSGVNSDITKENATMIGAPVQDYTDWLKSNVHFRNLPKLVNRLNDLEKEVKKLKGE